MRFRVVEGAYSDESQFDSFEKDYLNPKITIKEIKTKYNISKGTFNSWSRKVREKHGLKRKPVQAKYYTIENNSYVIRKCINQQTIYMGRIPVRKGKSTITKVIENCKELNWDIEKCRKLIREASR